MKKRKTDGNRVNSLSATRALNPKIRLGYSGNATVKEGLGSSKREVRFAETENDEILDASPIRFPRHQASRSDEASTSEFASFKKLKEDASQRLWSRTLCHDPKNSGTSSLTKGRSAEFVLQEKSGIAGNSNDYMMLHKDAPPDSAGALRTPAPHGLSEESGFDKMDNGMTMGNILSPRKISATLKPYVVASEALEVVRPDELFHRKRQRLRQWVTEVSYPESNDLSCNRYDTVSMMLNRLFPVRDPKLTSGKVKSLGSLELETCSRKCLTSAEKNLTQFDYGRPSDVSLASCWLGTPSHREPSNINFSIGGSPVPYLDYEIRELDYGNAGRAPPNSRGKSVYASHQLKEWDEACFSTECSSARPPNSLLLGWEFNKKNEGTLYWGAWENREMEGCSTTLSLWGDDRKKDVEDRFSFSRLQTPSMQSYYHHQKLPSGRVSELARSDKIAILEDMRLPLENEDNNAWYAPQDQRWHLGNEDRYAGDIETGSTSWFDFGSRQKCLPWNGSSKPLALEFHQLQGSPEQLLCGDVFEDSWDVHHQDVLNHLRADTENVDGRWSCYFRKSQAKETALPLLLDKSHWDVGVEDRYY